MATRYILTIDGGGMYGIIPAQWCLMIEQETGKRMADLFDFIAGTSTGSVLTAGFCTGYTAAEALDFYTKDGENVFTNPRSSIVQFWRPRYRARDVITVLESYFHDKKLGDADPLRLMLTAYDMNTGTPEFFKSWRPHERDIRLVDAVVASSSAPTFHPLHMIKGTCYTDGGMFANNPAMCALAEARRLWPRDEILLVSLGTGVYFKDRVCNEQMRQQGLLKWAREIPTVFLDGQQDMVTYQLEFLVPHMERVTHFRHDIRLERSKHNDEVRPDVLAAVRRQAQAYAEGSADFERMIAVLKQKGASAPVAS